ncbi:dihydropteroate synthase [Candidatus Fukatsuia symbiotica]|uniref:Dihydropteroate synthase n=1 Tax=Candidatus Fukatsuia symbiotica TaxID=1878942 RepID=A0A2U8I2U0_9GAMM|nr:dihydropteroate synthase [Candidatus Fukatsuia symbiotica]AWK13420.1 dihydropteroate synthase [Candidatus Fukatsuia symbiotica]MEA9444313.1 dihydropteroate synthase [Candidatus Fukatsuia symbiotica]
MQLTARNLTLDLCQPQVMGILNVTPDSFSDGGQHNDLDKALKHAQAMITAGATLIDIGGESTRPGAKSVSEQEELDRVIPVVEHLAPLATDLKIWLSVDTYKAQVITEAAKAGAHLINDVRALQGLGALEAAASTDLPICLMHMQGNPKHMQQSPHYEDLLTEIDDFFQQRIDSCIAAGIAKNKLLLDPGFGFGKTLAHNYRLLTHLEKFHHFNLPLLVGMSRKSMVGQMLLGVPPKQRVTGSVACAVIAAMSGAKIIRVHDVQETVEAMCIVRAALSEKE